jgi:hypothetical protein
MTRLSSIAAAGTLRTLYDLGQEARMLKARIESAQQRNGERPSFLRARVTFRIKPDRRRATLPLGPEGERRRGSGRS